MWSLLRVSYQPVSVVLVSSLSEEEVLKRLHNTIQERKSSFPAWITDESSPFFGKITGHAFSGYQLSYSNSFNPQIVGTVTVAEAGVEISILMTLHRFAQANIRFGQLFLILFLALVLLLMRFDVDISPSEIRVFVLGVAVLLLFTRWFWSVGVNAFQDSAVRHIKHFAKLLDAEVKSSSEMG